ncbi:MAG: hypothetical protein EWM47_10775 [Anaerolineaceae bacterium]|nr:MAG: hypothetical protein EWM47_10775 [Anaerolineaceae bacterium]
MSRQKKIGVRAHDYGRHRIKEYAKRPDMPVLREERLIFIENVCFSCYTVHTVHDNQSQLYRR